MGKLAGGRRCRGARRRVRRREARVCGGLLAGGCQGQGYRVGERPQPPVPQLLASAFQSLTGEPVYGTSAAVLGALGRFLWPLPCSSRSTRRPDATLPPRHLSRPSSRCSPMVTLLRGPAPPSSSVSSPQPPTDTPSTSSRGRPACAARSSASSGNPCPRRPPSRARHGLHLVSGSNRTAACFAELGAVLVVVELVLDADKRTSEKALAVLNGVLCRHRPRVRVCARAGRGGAGQEDVAHVQHGHVVRRLCALAPPAVPRTLAPARAAMRRCVWAPSRSCSRWAAAA